MQCTGDRNSGETRRPKRPSNACVIAATSGRHDIRRDSAWPSPLEVGQANHASAAGSSAGVKAYLLCRISTSVPSAPVVVTVSRPSSTDQLVGADRAGHVDGDLTGAAVREGRGLQRQVRRGARVAHGHAEAVRAGDAAGGVDRAVLDVTPSASSVDPSVSPSTACVVAAWLSTVQVATVWWCRSTGCRRASAGSRRMSVVAGAASRLKPLREC